MGQGPADYQVPEEREKSQRETLPGSAGTEDHARRTAGFEFSFFRPFGACGVVSDAYPRLAPWAEFFRRFAAGISMILAGLFALSFQKALSRMAAGD